MRMTRWRGIASAMVVALAVAACGGDDDANTEVEDASHEADGDADDGDDGDDAQGDDDGATETASGELRVATSTLAATLDPAAELSASYLRSHGAAEALFRIQADGSVAPELALSAEQLDPTTWEVELRDGVTFWSGDSLDAAAVAAWLERVADVNALGGGLLEGISVEVADDLTLRFVTESPSPDLLTVLSHYQLVIANVAAYDDEPGGTDPDAADLTGPFRVTGFATDRTMELERNDAWWGPAPSIERVVVQQVDDAQSRAEVAATGQADIVQEVPADQADRIGGAPDVDLVAAPAANTVTVYLNPESENAPALSDVRVRQALAWAIDRDEVVILATGGLSTPASSWLASNPAFPAAAEQGFTTHDPDLADELLTDAGWELVDGVRTKDGEPLRLRLLTFGAEERTGEVLQAQWSRIGVDAAVANVDNTLIASSIETGDWDAVTQAWTTLGATGALLSNQISADGSANHGRYVFDDVPALLETATGSMDDAEREEALLALNQVLVDEVPLIPVHPRVQATAVAAHVEGFIAHPLQYENVVQPDMTLR